MATEASSKTSPTAEISKSIGAATNSTKSKTYAKNAVDITVTNTSNNNNSVTADTKRALLAPDKWIQGTVIFIESAEKIFFTPRYILTCQ